MKAKVMVLCASLLVLTACQSGEPESTGGPVCNQTMIESTIDMFLHESNLHITSFDALTCAPGWAYAQVTVTDDQDAQAQEKYLFQVVGENWVLKSPEIVCGTPTSDGSRPVDAVVTEELWDTACLTLAN